MGINGIIDSIRGVWDLYARVNSYLQIPSLNEGTHISIYEENCNLAVSLSIKDYGTIKLVYFMGTKSIKLYVIGLKLEELSLSSPKVVANIDKELRSSNTISLLHNLVDCVSSIEEVIDIITIGYGECKDLSFSKCGWYSSYNKPNGTVDLYINVEDL